jgi:DNA segregation ATPase FtsK/SpoIIIE-like protein
MITRKKLFKELSLKTPSPRYTKEVCGVVLAASTLYLFMSLISYHATDASFFYFSTQPAVPRNWGGAVGAQCAALAFYLFGCSAYVVVLIFVLSALLMFRRQSSSESRPALRSLGEGWGRLAGLVASSVAAAGLCAVLRVDPLYSAPGGLLGYGVDLLVSPLFGYQGSLIVLTATLWVGLLCAARISLFDIVARGVLLGMNFCWWLCVQACALVKTTASFGLKALKKMYQKIKPVRSVIQVVFEPAHAAGQHIFTQKAQEEVYGFDAQKPEPQASHTDFSEPVVQDEVNAGNDAESTLDLELECTGEELGEILVRTTSVTTMFGKYPLRRLPNSVLGVNPFSLRLSDGELWCDHLCAALGSVQALDQHERFILPDAHAFTAKPKSVDVGHEQDMYAARGKMLEEKLARFGLNGQVTAITPGPVITLFEYKPDIDSKISKIIALEDDLAMVLTALSIRIIAPIPGKNVVGFEISNQARQDIFISQALCTPSFEEFAGYLPLVLGVDVTGNPVMLDLVSMPHVLVAGATGSGKSVGMNAMLVSLLCKRTPDELKLVLIDPKRLEFTPYTDIPHLLFPIVTQPHKAAGVLKWLVSEMEERYQRMAAAGVRSVVEYQKLAKEGKRDKDGNKFEPMPFIVVMIDELADLMMVAARDVETQIIRLAQMARAAGIHLIVATQRPSVDVVTGLIKVNFPSRISFRVSSKVDSRTILDASGAEKLLGRGDLLFMNAASPDLRRVHGAFVSDQEIERLAHYLRAQAAPQYLDLNEELSRCTTGSSDEQEDELYDSVITFLKSVNEISISMLQRQYRIGFNRSARIIEKLELDGLIAPAQGSKPRKVLH